MEEEEAWAAVGLRLQLHGDATGPTPTPGSMCDVYYRGRLGSADGAPFDAAWPPQPPLRVRVGRAEVIAAWDVALLRMAVGQRATLVAPPALAYGRKGRPPKITAAATLHFELWLAAAAADADERLADAAAEGDAPALLAALHAGAGVARADRKGWAALHRAAGARGAECVVRLLEAKAPPDAPCLSPAGVTPLMLAARRGAREAVEALLLASASPAATSAKGNSALSIAQAANDEAVLALLRAPPAGATPSRLGVGGGGDFDSAEWEAVRARSLWLGRVRAANPRVWMELEYTPAAGGGAVRSPRLEMELWADVVPRTAENFRCLCTGEKGKAQAFGAPPLHFKGCAVHRIVPEQVFQAGDFTTGDGRGGESIYGRTFADESFEGRAGQHSSKGLLSMANAGRNSNGSQFFITLDALPHLDGKHVVFGEVTQGMPFVQALAAVAGTPHGAVAGRVVIAACGQTR